MIVLDEELQGLGLEAAVARWYRGAVFIVKHLRPGTIIKDDAIPQLLSQAKHPTFVTINHSDFWRRAPAHESYCIICLKLTTEEIEQVSPWLRRLFSLPEFRTKLARMGRVVLAGKRGIQYYSTTELVIHIRGWLNPG